MKSIEVQPELACRSIIEHERPQKGLSLPIYLSQANSCRSKLPPDREIAACFSIDNTSKITLLDNDVYIGQVAVRKGEWGRWGHALS
jgi:hypothetical protein